MTVRKKTTPVNVDAVTASWPIENIERRAVADLLPYARNAKKHSGLAIEEIVQSIKEWGWTTPLLIDEEGVLIAGHKRVLAAHKLNIKDLPVMVARGWSEQQKAAYRLADNKLALNSDWDLDLLRLEIEELDGFPLHLIGFSPEELNDLIDGSEDAVDLTADNSGESQSGTDVDVLKIGKKKVPMTVDEFDRLQRLVEVYCEEFGVINGFVSWICDGKHVTRPQR